MVLWVLCSESEDHDIQCRDKVYARLANFPYAYRARQKTSLFDVENDIDRKADRIDQNQSHYFLRNANNSDCPADDRLSTKNARRRAQE